MTLPNWMDWMNLIIPRERLPEDSLRRLARFGLVSVVPLAYWRAP